MQMIVFIGKIDSFEMFFEKELHMSNIYAHNNIILVLNDWSTPELK